jgi:hypothetical protein
MCLFEIPNQQSKMNCLISRVLEEGITKRKNIYVIQRYLRMKYHIKIADRLLASRMTEMIELSA